MVLKIDDWIFQVDFEETAEHSSYVSSEHCTCGYCENYYRTVELAFPELKPFLARFGVLVDAPSELYPIAPTLYLSGYRVTGEIRQFGSSPMMAGTAPVMAEPSEGGTFLLEVGEIPLPWILEEDMDEVISPANEPEFLERMYRKLISRDGYTGAFYS